MRHILTGDHWSAEEAYRMGAVQMVAPDAKEALEAGIRIANKIADCGPLGVKTSLASDHMAIDHSEEEALSKLNAQFGASVPHAGLSGRPESRGGRSKTGLPGKISANQKPCDRIGLIRFQPYEGGSYAICRSVYQRNALQYCNDRGGRRPNRFREDDRLDERTTVRKRMLPHIHGEESAAFA